MTNSQTGSDSRVIKIFAAGCAAAFMLICAIIAIKAFLPSEKSEGALEYVSESDGSIIGRRIELKEENFWGDGERHVRIKNMSDHPAYVRVTPYYTVRASDGSVCDAIIRDGEVLALSSADWLMIGQSYYYKYPLAARKYTPFLIEGCSSLDPSGKVLEVRFEISGIDAEDVKTVRDRWKVSVTDEGVIEG